MVIFCSGHSFALKIMEVQFFGGEDLIESVNVKISKLSDKLLWLDIRIRMASFLCFLLESEINLTSEYHLLQHKILSDEYGLSSMGSSLLDHRPAGQLFFTKKQTFSVILTHGVQVPVSLPSLTYSIHCLTFFKLYGFCLHSHFQIPRAISFVHFNFPRLSLREHNCEDIKNNLFNNLRTLNKDF